MCFSFQSTYYLLYVNYNSLSKSALWCCVCIINRYCTLPNWPIVRLLILQIFLVMFLYFSTWLYSMLYHSLCCNVSYYNYRAIWPYYIVIYSTEVYSSSVKTFMLIRFSVNSYFVIYAPVTLSRISARTGANAKTSKFAPIPVGRTRIM